MSIQYSDILTKVRDNVGANSTSFTSTQITTDVNLGIDNIMLFLFGEGAGGRWQLDDANHTNYPILTTNLVSGQRDYAFTTDEDGNVVLDFYKVQAMDSAGVYHDLDYVDMFGVDAPTTMTDGQDTTGTPTTYDLSANGVILDVIPSYNKTNGLRCFVNRESSYFTPSDTTKKWGFTGIYHEYLVLYASYQYARAKMLSNKNDLKVDLLEMEQKIKKHAGQRLRVANRFEPATEDNR